MKLKTIVILVIAVPIIYSLLNPAPLKGFLSKYHLLPEPEPLTELYFEDHTKLPSVMVPGKKETFKFTVHNIEYKDMVYHYEVYAESEKGDKEVLTSPAGGQISNGEVSLAHDEYKTIQIDFKQPKKLERTKVVVNLIDQNQPIHFWLNPPGTEL